jgi:hypothetical protein
VIDEYAVDEEMQEAKRNAIEVVDELEDGDIYSKADALSKVIDPVTIELANMTGEAFVSTMSQETVTLYSDAAAFWANTQEFTPYNSVNWGTKIP